MDALRAIDLNLLLMLHALLQERSVTKAARRVGISQPAMSHALSRLRLHFDDALLLRDGRVMRATPRALQLQDEVAAAVRQAERVFSRDDFEPARMRGRLRLMSDDHIGTTLLPQVVAALNDQAPDLHIDVTARGAPGRKRSLRTGAVDLTLGYFSGAGRDLHRAVLWPDDWVCLLRSSLPAQALTLSTFAALDHVVVSPTGGDRGAVDDALEARGLRRRVAVTVPHFLVALSLAAATDLVLTTSRSFAEAHAERFGLVVHPPPLDLPGFEICMLWHARTHEDRAQQWVREVVLATASARAPGLRGSQSMIDRARPPGSLDSAS